MADDPIELPPIDVTPGTPEETGPGGGPGSGAPVIDPPWRLDPLQNIVNVSWDDGIAVHFEFEWYGIEGQSHWFEDLPGR